MYMSIKCADSACFNIAKVYAAVGTALVGEGGASSWTLVETEMDEDVQFIQATASTAAAAETAVVKTTQQSPVQLDSDSEEDDVIVVGSTSASASSVSTMMPRKQINLSKAVRKRKCK